jgi:hypothetical protein
MSMQIILMLVYPYFTNYTYATYKHCFYDLDFKMQRNVLALSAILNCPQTCT